MSRNKKKVINICVGILAILLVGGGVTALIRSEHKSSSEIVSSEKRTSGSNEESSINSSSSSEETSSVESSSKETSSQVEEKKGLFIVDGSIDSSLKTTFTDETTNFSYEIKGISSLSSVTTADQYCEETSKTYTRAINTGGSSSSSKYIKLVVPQDLKIKVSVVGSSTSSMYIFITDKIESTYNESNYYSLNVTSKTWSFNSVCEEMGTGTYYINFSGNLKIAQIEVSFIF